MRREPLVATIVSEALTPAKRLPAVLKSDSRVSCTCAPILSIKNSCCSTGLGATKPVITSGTDAFRRIIDTRPMFGITRLFEDALTFTVTSPVRTMLELNCPAATSKKKEADITLKKSLISAGADVIAVSPSGM